MASKVEKFMENHSLEELLALKRIELIDLAAYLGVSIKKYFKKQQILDEIILNFVDNETLEEQAMEYVSKEEVSEAVKIKQMEYGRADTFLSRIFSHENNGYSDVSMTVF